MRSNVTKVDITRIFPADHLQILIVKMFQSDFREACKKQWRCVAPMFSYSRSQIGGYLLPAQVNDGLIKPVVKHRFSWLCSIEAPKRDFVINSRNHVIANPSIVDSTLV